MNEFLKMDIFFFMTTVAIVLCTFFGFFLFLRLSRILKNIEHISEQVALESDSIRDDLDIMRGDLKRGKGRLKSFLDFFGTRVRGASKHV